MPKNIIICCDGTGNEIKENQSNVLLFFRTLEKNSAQTTFYDPGVGTISDSSAWARLKSQAKGIFGLATGYGLDANILDAYRFLIRNYEDGDNIYLFGFSRGAYTVRVLAGFLNMIGLLETEQENLSGYALMAYKQASNKDDFKIAWRYHQALATKYVTIRFMGCWDTVGSVIVPRPDRFLIPSLQSLPYTRTNPSVQAFRHAIAIDERRRMFRASLWTEPQKFKMNPFIDDDQAEEQDIKQVWFAGVHSDIGGGYPDRESGSARIPLQWMVEEAREHGVQFKQNRINQYVLGKKDGRSKEFYAAPDPEGPLHDSMKGFWPVLEWLPKKLKRREWADRRSFLSWYLPRSEPRLIPENATIDASVWTRRQGQSGYDPINLKDFAPPEEDQPTEEDHRLAS
ncbi:MAG: DUF2235 domain-containing protein [Pseudomonadota bacterium]